MRRRPLLGYVVIVGVAIVFAGLVSSVAGLYHRSSQPPNRFGAPVSFAQVQNLFAASCASCHPVVVASLDLRPAAAYRAIVGVRAQEAPGLARVVAGDPEHSYLYLKIAGWPGNGGNPIVGGRMPFGAPRLKASDIDLVRRWIGQGARNEQGKTVSAAEVATPGNVAALGAAAVPQVTTGDGTIAGTVYDAHHRPLAGAIVTMLLVRKDLPGGEEHYLASVSDAQGRYAIRRTPVGRVEIKAYAPKTVYVSRLLDTAAGRTTNGDIGLPQEAFQNPTIAGARVTRSGDRLALSMNVAGNSLDRNYTLAVNVASGRVFELRATPDGSERPGPWGRTIPAAGTSGGWTFLAVSHACNVSNFIDVGPA